MLKNWLEHTLRQKYLTRNITEGERKRGRQRMQVTYDTKEEGCMWEIKGIYGIEINKG